MGRFDTETRTKWWYGIPEIYFIWHNEWADPEIEYKGLVFNPYWVGIEENNWDYLKEELGREPTDEEFEQFMKDDGENIKYQLAWECMPERAADWVIKEIESLSYVDNLTIEDVEDLFTDLKETTIIRPEILDSIYAKIAKQANRTDGYVDGDLQQTVGDLLNNAIRNYDYSY